jgi:hypothetical protein
MAPKEIKHLFTEKGDVLSAIVIYGANTFSEIEFILSQTSFERWTELHVLLKELIQEGDVVLNEAGEYRARAELEEDYSYFEQHMDEWLEPPIYMGEPEPVEQVTRRYPDIVSTTESWIQLQKPEIVFKQEHFFLEGHYLDSFTRFLLTKAFNTIIIVNPFIDRSTPTQLLIKAKRRGKTVVMVTRPSNKAYMKKLHGWLEHEGVKMLYHKDLHAKIIIIDDSLAIVSSMNFMQRATAGITWEAGISTVNKDIVDSIKASLADLNLQGNQ